MKLPKNILILFVFYFISLILIYFLFLTLNLTKDIFVRAFIFSIPIFFILLLSKLKKFKITIPKIKGEDYLARYDMICHKCNWEWMSHSANKAPSQCPNCNTTQKNMLEIVGWRKLNLNTKRDKDLRSFIKA
ncbi:hypothetical protein CL621_02330 [archaeon]|nr:hypothetical protein [archaeon]|tara:strand:- start:526 stop:921 length:396 start_codon:yes stop_codon:yes gene_type:complete